MDRCTNYRSARWQQEVDRKREKLHLQMLHPLEWNEAYSI